MLAISIVGGLVFIILIIIITPKFVPLLVIITCASTAVQPVLTS